jgi:hypothetical protein
MLHITYNHMLSSFQPRDPNAFKYSRHGIDALRPRYIHICLYTYIHIKPYSSILLTPTPYLNPILIYTYTLFKPTYIFDLCTYAYMHMCIELDGISEAVSTMLVGGQSPEQVCLYTYIHIKPYSSMLYVIILTPIKPTSSMSYVICHMSYVTNTYTLFKPTSSILKYLLNPPAGLQFRHHAEVPTREGTYIPIKPTYFMLLTPIKPTY